MCSAKEIYAYTKETCEYAQETHTYTNETDKHETHSLSDVELRGGVCSAKRDLHIYRAQATPQSFAEHTPPLNSTVERKQISSLSISFSYV